MPQRGMLLAGKETQRLFKAYTRPQKAQQSRATEKKDKDIRQPLRKRYDSVRTYVGVSACMKGGPDSDLESSAFSFYVDECLSACLRVFVPPVCLVTAPEKGCQIPQNWSDRSLCTGAPIPDGCWEPNLNPLLERQVLLTTEPFLWRAFRDRVPLVWSSLRICLSHFPDFGIASVCRYAQRFYSWFWVPVQIRQALY